VLELELAAPLTSSTSSSRSRSCRDIPQIWQAAEKQASSLDQRIACRISSSELLVSFFESSGQPQLASIRECRKYWLIAGQLVLRMS